MKLPNVHIISVVMHGFYGTASNNFNFLNMSNMLDNNNSLIPDKITVHVTYYTLS